MEYPTKAEVEDADKKMLAMWYLFLPQPHRKDAEKKKILNLVIKRLRVHGGMTNSLMKETRNLAKTQKTADKGCKGNRVE